MKNTVREMVRTSIENYLLAMDIEDIIDEMVRGHMEDASLEEMLEMVFDIEAIVGEELGEALEEMLE